jgi:hypothetical protein
MFKNYRLKQKLCWLVLNLMFVTSLLASMPAMNSAAAADSMPPFISSTSPASGAYNIPIGNNISIRFSEKVLPGPTATYNSISVMDAGGNPVAFVKNISGGTLVINPVKYLSTGTYYKVTIPAGALKDANGNKMRTNYSFSFTTSTPMKDTNTNTTTPVTSTTPVSNVTSITPASDTTAPVTSATPASDTTAPVTSTTPASDTTAPVTSTTPVSDTTTPVTSTTPASDTTTPTDPAAILAAAGVKADAAFSDANIKLANAQQAYRSWAIQAQPSVAESAYNVRLFGITGDGITDDTVKLQKLLNSVPSESVLFFPAGIYKINGPVIIDKGFTFVGEPGSIIDCSKATVSTVFNINPKGSSSSFISNIVITGMEFVGPGIESDPAIIDVNYTSNFKFTNSKMRDIGYAAIRLIHCEDSTVENCVFDNVFKTALGYGVAIANQCNNIYVQNNFFVRLGRHGVTTGCIEGDPTPDQYPLNMTVRNNYFENMTEEAINTHAPTKGPININNNVIYNCAKGVQLRNGVTEIADNVVVKCNMGIVLHGDNMPRVVKNNTVVETRWESVYVDCPNVQISGNIVKGSIGCLSPSDCIIQQNIIVDTKDPIGVSPGGPTIITKDNIAKDANGLRFI